MVHKVQNYWDLRQINEFITIPGFAPYQTDRDQIPQRDETVQVPIDESLKIGPIRRLWGMIFWQKIYLEIMQYWQKWVKHSVEILELFCHSDFTWNQIWHVRSLKNCQFWHFHTVWILILSSFRIALGLKFLEIKMQTLQNYENIIFWGSKF